MQIVKITSDGRDNLIGMPEMKRRILSLLLMRQMRLVELIDKLKEQYEEYRYLKTRNFAQAVSDLVSLKMIEVK